MMLIQLSFKCLKQVVLWRCGDDFLKLAVSSRELIPPHETVKHCTQAVTFWLKFL